MKEIEDRVCAVLIRALDHRRDESALVLLGRRAAGVVGTVFAAHPPRKSRARGSRT